MRSCRRSWRWWPPRARNCSTHARPHQGLHGYRVRPMFESLPIIRQGDVIPAGGRVTMEVVRASGGDHPATSPGSGPPGPTRGTIKPSLLSRCPAVGVDVLTRIVVDGMLRPSGSSPLVSAPEPGPGAERSTSREVVAAHIRGADHGAVDDNTEVELPVFSRGPHTPGDPRLSHASTCGIPRLGL